MTGVWVSLPYATFGVQVHQNVVMEAAPIARWMVGKTWDPQITDWIKTKRGIWKVI